MRALLLLVAACVLLTNPAYAATIDLNPIITPVFSAIAVGLSIGAGFVLRWGFKFLKARTGVELVGLETQLNAAVSGFAFRAIDAALIAARKRVGTGDGKIVIDNLFISTAVDYLMKAAPGYLKKLGVVKADGSLDDVWLRKYIEARLPMSEAADLPVVAK